MGTKGKPDNGDREVFGSKPGLPERYVQALLSSAEYRRIRQALVSPRLVAESGEFAETLSADAVDLGEVLKNSRRVVVLGDVGAGKTSLFRSVAYDYAASFSRPEQPNLSSESFCDERRIPIYLSLKPSCAVPIEQQIALAVSEVAGLDVGPAEMRGLLQHEKLLLLFDEFSRVAPQHQLETLNALVRFVTSEYPNQSYAIAIRVQDFPMLEAWFKDMPVLTIQPLDDREIALLVSRLLDEKNSAILFQRLSSDADWWEMARNPLVLSTACAISSRDVSAGDAAFIDRLVGELIARIGEPGAADGEMGALRDEFRVVLAELAMKMLRKGASSLERGERQHRVAENGGSAVQTAQNGVAEAHRDEDDLFRRLIDSGILEFGVDAQTVKFRYPLFKQFFGVVAIEEARSRGLTLRELATGPGHDSDKEKSVILYVVNSTDRRRLIAELVGDKSAYENILLAAKCLASIGENAYRELVGIDPANVGLYQQFGRAFRQLKCYCQAQQALEDAVKLDSNRASAHQELAEVLVEQGNLAAAAREYDIAFRLSGNEVDYRFGMASISVKDANLAEALAQIKAAGEALSVIQADLHHRRGHILEAGDNIDEALREYHTAVEMSDAPHFWFHIGALYRRSGRLSDAEAALRHAISARFDDADAHYEMGALLEECDKVAEALEEYRIAAHLQRSPTICLALGRVYRKLGRLAQAEAELQRAIGLEPSMSEAIAELGLVHERRGEHDNALDCYRQALRIKPDVPEYYQRTGWLLKSMGRLDEAEVELAIAVKLAPSKAEYREQLGAVLADRGNYAAALEQYEIAASICQADPTYRHHIGVMQSRLGNSDAAIAALSEAIELCSTEAGHDEQLSLSTVVVAADAHSELGLLYEKLEDWQHALRHYRAAAELMPFAKVYWLRQGLVHRRLGQLDKALKLLRRAASLDPEDSEIHAELGLTHEAAGDISSALEEYCQAFELSPDRAAYAVSLAKAHRRLNQFVEAKQAMAAALEKGLESAEMRREMAVVCVEIGELDAALEQSRRAVAIEPDSPLSHIILARALLAAGRREESLQELKTAIALGPDVAEAYYHLARAHAQGGSTEEARSHAVRAVALSPGEEEYAYLAGRLCAMAGATEEAIEHLKRAAHSSNALPLWHVELGELFESSGRLEEALAEYQRAAEKDGNPAPHLFRAGNVLFALGRHSEAAEMLLRTVSLDPKFVPAYATLGSVLLQMRQPETATDRFLKACELEPQEAGYWAGLASAYLAQDKLEEAASSLGQALALKPENASWHHSLGRVFERLAAWDRALERLENAVDLAPSNAEYAHDLGIACCRMGRYDTASKWLRKALSLDDRRRWREELGDVLFILGDLSGALAEYLSALSQNPSDWRCQRRLGLLYLKLDRTRDAVDALESACDLAGANGVDLAAHYALGLAYAGVGRFSDALKEQTIAAEKAPNCAAVHSALGAVHREILAKAAGVATDSEEYRLALYSLRHALTLDPDLAEAHSELGALEESIGNETGALDKHYKAITLDPACPRYRCNAARIYVKMGRIDEAEKLVREGLQTVSDDPLLTNQLGLIYEARRLFHEALDAFDRAASLDPSRPLYRFNAGRIRLYMNKQAEAQRDLEEAVRMNPREPAWRQHLARLYEQSEDLDRAAEEFRAVVELEPENGSALLGLGRALARLGRLDEAIEHLQRAAAIEPSAAVSDQLAIVRRQQGQLRDALHYSQQALKREPQNYAYQLNLALTLKALGQTQKAGDEIRRIASEAPSLVPARYHLGELYEEKGELQRALAEYIWAMAMAPKEAVYAVSVARVRRLLGQVEDALALMEARVEASPDDPEVFAELARTERARGNFERAIHYFQRAIAMQDRPVFHYELANLLSQMRRPGDAFAEMRVAAAMEPRNPKWQNGLGQLLEEQGKLDEAMEFYRKALNLDPRNAESHRNLGVALKKRGRFDEAIQALQRALDLNPDYTDAYRHLTAASASQLLRKTLRKES